MAHHPSITRPAQRQLQNRLGDTDLPQHLQVHRLYVGLEREPTRVIGRPVHRQEAGFRIVTRESFLLARLALVMRPIARSRAFGFSGFRRRIFT